MTAEGTGEGVGIGVGGGVGGWLTAVDAVGAGEGVGLAWATGVGLGGTIGGRLLGGSPSTSSVPMIMRVTPATPRMMGSAQPERRFT